MSTMLLSLAFDIVLSGLLLATILYCAKLSKRIHFLQESKSELSAMIIHFNQATERAAHSLSELQTVSKKITEALQVKLDKANFLADDMAFLIEKGTKLATQLEQARNQTTLQVPSVSVTTANSEEENRTQMLETLLQRFSPAPSNDYSPQPETSSLSPLQPRTNAERELIQALKTGRS